MQALETLSVRCEAAALQPMCPAHSIVPSSENETANALAGMLFMQAREDLQHPAEISRVHRLEFIAYHTATRMTSSGSSALSSPLDGEEPPDEGLAR